MPTGDFPFPDGQYHPVLAKALLVHAASWGPLRSGLAAVLSTGTDVSRRALSRLLGYGAVEPQRVATAQTNRVLLMGAGSISADERKSFAFPVPPSLAATTEWRRLTVTLAWLSPVNTRTRRHRMARLSFEPPCDGLGATRSDADWRAVRKGTVQHELIEGGAALAFAAGDSLRIDVDCRVDAGRLDAPVRYGLAATLEVGATVATDIHAEVRQQLQARLRAEATLAAR